MARISRFCTNCGSELDRGAKFCAQCGTPTRQNDAPVAASEASRQPRQDDAPLADDEGSRRLRQEDAPVAADEGSKQPRKSDAPAAADKASGQTRKDSAPVAASEASRQPRQEDAPVAADEGSKQPRKSDAPAAADKASGQTRKDSAPATASEAGRQPRQDDAPAAAAEAWSGYKRFLRVDPSGGFFAIVTPLMIWTVAAGILSWAVLGLLSLRFDLSFLNLQDLFFTMLIIIGIMLSVVANAYLVLSYRERKGALAQVLRQLPMVWAAGLCVGLLIMIWQVWTDFAGGPNELRRAMFSVVGIGVCGTYGGYLSLVAIGPDRIYLVARRVVYVLIAVIAVEILDALWWGTRHLTGAEIGTHFVRAGWTAFSCVVVYSIIAFFMAQARAKKLQISMLVAYLVLGVIGFTIAVGALWDTFPPGAIRFVHGAIVLVTVATIGLLMVQHFHRKRDAGNPPLASTGVSGQPSTTTAL